MFKSKLTTIVAVTALVVAVLGTTPLGHAASNFVLAKNSVGASQIKKNAVTGRKISNNAVTSLKVKDGTLLAADFKAGQIPAGPQGAKGDPGAQGPKGDPGVVKLTVVNRQSPWTSVPAGGTVTVSAPCQAGEVATGGGPVGLESGMILRSSNAAEVPTPISWRVSITNTNAVAKDFSVDVVCATA